MVDECVVVAVVVWREMKSEGDPDHSQTVTRCACVTVCYGVTATAQRHEFESHIGVWEQTRRAGHGCVSFGFSISATHLAPLAL